MGSSRVLAAIGGALLFVAACSSSASPASSPAAPASAASSEALSPSASPAAPSVAASASTAPSAAAISTSIDPCALLTSADVKTFTGVAYGAGKESTSGALRTCGYASGSGAAASEVHVQVLDASSASDATVAYQEAYTKQQAAQNGIVLTKVSGVGDEAVTLGLSSALLSAEGIYVRKGKVFFDITYLATGTGSAPSVDALKAAALAALGRLP